MSKRKGKGEGRARRGTGTIWEYRPGRFRGQIDLGIDAQGRRLRPSATGRSYKEVQDKLDAFKQDALMGRPVKPEKLTVAQHFEDWLRTKRPPMVRSATYLKYERLTKDHILPAFGHLQVKVLDYRRINAFYETLDKKGLERSTVASIAAVLRMGLEDAVRKGLIATNPAKLAASRTAGNKEARFLTQDEIRRFLEAAGGERLEDAFVTALNTGLRPGELFGLSWDAIDWDAKKLTVRQALHEEDGHLFLGEVKTKAARRTISLPPAAVAALKRQRKRQLEEKLAAGPAWQNEANLVFTDTQGRFLRRTNVLKRDMKRILKRSGLIAVARRCGIALEQLLEVNPSVAGAGILQAGQEIRLPAGQIVQVLSADLLEGVALHTFRHTHASVLIFQREDIKTVSRRLGHENITITLQTYGHLLPGQDERAAEAMDRFMASL